MQIGQVQSREQGFTFIYKGKEFKYHKENDCLVYQYKDLIVIVTCMELELDRLPVDAPLPQEFIDLDNELNKYR
ncbi:hypothetical protein DNG14_16205 [Salmonella enterica]|nr:hypothetical protein [Salmonella enterica]ECS8659512.1 hypothetical protein [Salmonella enterica subsp. enterica serovar Cotham]EAP6464131.1 hypothetical protein [Salmonella enterica]EAQ7427271.1 hypothetical protein [Salmonella enterica]EAQ7460332.1 hypothetical protein [Salmonella enterica]